MAEFDIPIPRARWYACYTRARAEKVVESALRRKRIPSYLPMYPRERQWKDRQKVVQWPLFPSYVFGRFSLPQVHDVLTIPGLSTIVRFNGQPAAIPDEELENVRRFAAAIAVSGEVPQARPLVRGGEWVRVVEGPFQGIEGRVIEQRGRFRFLVGVGVIARALEVNMDGGVLRVIARPSWVAA